MNLEAKTLTEKFIYEGHSNTVRYVALNKEEDRIITCCEDQSLRVWDRFDKDATYLLAGHTDFAVCGGFLDDTTLVSTSWDLSVKIWKLPARE